MQSLGQVFAHPQVGFPLLSILVFLPMAGAILLAPLRNEVALRCCALTVAFIVFALSLLLPIFFQSGTSDMQFVEQVRWIPPIGASYHIGIDGISLWLVCLTTFLSFLVVLHAFYGVRKHVRAYLMTLLVLETTLLGVFIALDMLLFFLFWEVMLLPMYFLIKIWGGEKRDTAALKFVLYTLLGSVLMLVGLIVLYLNHREITLAQPFASSLSSGASFDYLDWLKTPFPMQTQIGVFLLLFFGFAFKVPMFPFHTWLPDAHVEAPTAGSVLLAGVLLKMGTYGFLRFSLPLLPLASELFAPWMLALAVASILYGALLALAQDDMKKLIAYSSISHLGFVILGIFSFNTKGLEGSLIQMVNHGISTSGLFFVVGFLYDRRHTRLIREYGGLSSRLPILATLYLLISLSSMALPGTNGFIGEFLILSGAALHDWRYAAIAMIGVFLGAAYLLWLFQRTMMGPLSHASNALLSDLHVGEIGVLGALLIMVFWVGLFPAPFLSRMEASTGFVAARMVSPATTRSVVEAAPAAP